MAEFGHGLLGFVARADASFALAIGLLQSMQFGFLLVCIVNLLRRPGLRRTFDDMIA
jgi:hypothetical protein